MNRSNDVELTMRSDELDATTFDAAAREDCIDGLCKALSQCKVGNAHVAYASIAAVVVAAAAAELKNPIAIGA